MVSYGSAPSLVEYHKDGNWIYFPEHNSNFANELPVKSVQFSLAQDFKHMGPKLSYFFKDFNHLNLESGYDSLIVNYEGNKIIEFIGAGTFDYTHLQLGYHETPQLSLPTRRVRPQSIYNVSSFDPYINSRQVLPGFQIQTPDYLWNISATHEIGQLDKQNRRIGVWQSYNEYGKLYKTEKYIIPWKDERAELIQAK
jgi:hypothetical protein